jgi:hypothetical protein
LDIKALRADRDRGSAIVDSGVNTLREVLRISEPRPSASSPISEKIQYAVRFADAMAVALAEGLSPRLQGIQATTKRSAAAVSARKQLDVNFSTPDLGLALGISLKSVHIRDAGSAGRYTHNMKRNEEELRIEASGYHKRQPYAVMVGVLFLPIDSCTDGKKDNPSSFGSFVRKLRPYAGRADPHDDADKFERIFVALYEPDGSALKFFDIETAPPKNGAPKGTMSYEDFLDAVYHEFLKRNSAEFQWADGDAEPLSVAELENEP